jgi:hypothetical protein
MAYAELTPGSFDRASTVPDTGSEPVSTLAGPWQLGRGSGPQDGGASRKFQHLMLLPLLSHL